MPGYNPIGRETPIDGYHANAPESVTITTANTEIFAANNDTKIIFIANTGNQDVYLASGNNAESGKGFYLSKGDDMFIPVTDGINETINGITSVGSTTITMQVWE